MKIHQIIREYFSFTRGERIGLITLIVLIVLFIVANQVIFYFEKPGVADKQQFEILLDEFEATNEKQQTRLTHFQFDPNTIDSLTFARFLLPENVKRNILRYRYKGGHFRSKEDIRKIYGMNDSLYASVIYFIEIKENKLIKSKFQTGKTEVDLSKSKSKSTEKSETDLLFRIEINTATAQDFKKLYGIGDVLAERIVKYRKLLGGFYSLDQFEEVYGLPEETFLRIIGQLEVDTTKIYQININFADVKELAAHPYLNWENANKIQKYKSKRGFIEHKDWLLKDSVLNERVFQKIYPYLKTNN